MPLADLRKFEGFRAGAATGAPSDCYEEGPEGTRHAFEAGLEVGEALEIGALASRLPLACGLPHEMITIWVLGGKNSSEK